MNIIRKMALLYIFTCSCAVFYAQDVRIESNPAVTPGKIRVTNVINNSDSEIRVRFDGHGGGNSIGPRKSRTFDITCDYVETKPLEGKWTIKAGKKPTKQAEELSVASGQNLPKTESPQKKDGTKTNDKKDKEVKKKQDEAKKQEKDKEKDNAKKRNDDNERTRVVDDLLQPTPNKEKAKMHLYDVMSDFFNHIEGHSFYSTAAIGKEAIEVDDHIEKLRNWKDKDEYIESHYLKNYIHDYQDTINRYEKNMSSWISRYIDSFGDKEIVNKEECIDSIQAVLSGRLEQRKNNLKRLSDEIGYTPSEINWALWGSVGGGLLLCSLIFVWLKKGKKYSRSTTLAETAPEDITSSATQIVVRSKTNAILRKQCLDDVIDNPSYLKIDCKEFCDDSTVRTMYLKNTCIKDIYNMYAEDLRNPNNPKEDGCMVLGRWVCDNDTKEYIVSLEQIVLPGDDAVFAEYELNFGGKIKLKLTEKLRKLRRESSLQYDLTCWVHSHPGLGVFFSNSDNNVQMQLKHPTHPNFLTAFVIDILTPQQEMGIFTFKHDSSINSKADIKRLYSLEALYKWAVESERSTFKSEDYYNSLESAEKRTNACYGIELSNSAVIDMGMLISEQSSGIVRLIHGFSNQQGQQTEYIANTISKNEMVPDNELIGCFVSATHCSIPSIRKAITPYIGKIKFVLVYTTSDGKLTSIPVIGHDLCTNEKYYGEQAFEELKIWTRRRR